MKAKYSEELISCLLAMLFIYAACSKLLQYQEFKNQLSQSPFIQRYAYTLVWALPVLEIIIAASLLFKQIRIVTFYTSFCLLVLFTFYLIAMLKYSYYIPCSCGGVLASLSWPQHIVFNLFFIIITLMGIVNWYKHNRAFNKPYIYESF